MNDICRTVIWVILLGSGGLLIGCDQGPLVPSSPPSWDEIRYHEYEGDVSVDLRLTQPGRLSYTEMSSGEKSVRQGVLSGSTLEELDRAVNGLERTASASDDPCEGGLSFFVSVTKDGSLFSFSGSSCGTLPEGQAALVETLQRFVFETREARLAPVAFRSVGAGRANLAAGAHLVGSEDELSLLLQRISESQPVVWPAVNFDRNILVGYVGESEVVGVDIEGIAMTDGGQLRLQIRESVGVGDCPRLDGRPYEFVSVTRVSGDFVIERDRTEVSCENSL